MIASHSRGYLVTIRHIIRQLYLKAVEQQYGKMPKSFKLIYLGDTDKNGNYKERLFESIDGNKFVCKVGNKEYIQDITEQLRVVKKLFSQIKAGKFSAI